MESTTLTNSVHYASETWWVNFTTSWQWNTKIKSGWCINLWNWSQNPSRTIRWQLNVILSSCYSMWSHSKTHSTLEFLLEDRIFVSLTSGSDWLPSISRHVPISMRWCNLNCLIDRVYEARIICYFIPLSDTIITTTSQIVSLKIPMLFGLIMLSHCKENQLFVL
jgi:hypothetical protein